MIHVSIADDHPLFREGIKKTLQNEIDIELICEASDGNNLLALLKERLPDIVILDISMPGRSGLDLIKDINTWYPKLPILILSIHPAERFAVRALKAGASGYLSKSSISDELVDAIRRIINRKRKYITPEIAEQLVHQIDLGNCPLHVSLSNREFEVMCMIAEGKDINRIAEELSLSPSTIHSYRTRIKEKMGLTSNIEMTRYAIENELIN